MKTLWQKSTAAADWVHRFTVGEDYRWDTYLLPYDIAGTRAHARGLAQIGLLEDAELDEIEAALDDLLEAFAARRVAVRPQDEDCHTVIEHFLTERLGDVGKKIHAGRSRNDQVLVALRLFLKDALDDAAERTVQLAEALCTLAGEHPSTLMPGYTHMQRAMPSTVALWAMGYAELLATDVEALAAACRQIDTSPLGSAAGYGVPHLDLPRDAVAQDLGFARLQRHVTSVQLSRGKQELHVAHAFAQVTATVNRLASDLVLFNTAEYGFVHLPDAYCTGSSIMPQKKNPDVLELARASYHRVIAEMQILLTLPANLSSGYHRDLQLTKEAVMRGSFVTRDVLVAMNHLLPGISFDEKRMAAACTPELYATADALRRVKEGVPFREAYREAARGVGARTAPDNECPDRVADTYVTAGGPFHCRPDDVRAALAAALEPIRARRGGDE